ncbi:hypothetical protein M0804_004927 [Polistes exclamans]|nr:hypothetical protein M0804_004927 [Polistes exclamans]
MKSCCLSKQQVDMSYQQVSDLVASQLARQGVSRSRKCLLRALDPKMRQKEKRREFLREPRTSSRKCCGVPPVRSSEYSSPSNELLSASCGGQFGGSCGSIANETLETVLYYL